MSWWTQKRYRMIQNNLRDIDACMDVDRYVEYLKEKYGKLYEVE